MVIDLLGDDDCLPSPELDSTAPDISFNWGGGQSPGTITAMVAPEIQGSRTKGELNIEKYRF
jgi:hypothetical protein